MSKLVELRLEGNLEQEVTAYLEIKQEGKPPLTDSGSLPPAPELTQSHIDWKNSYRSLDGRRRIKAKAPQIINVSLEKLKRECQNKAKQLKQDFNNWLASEQFRPLREKLLHQLTPNEEVRVVVRSASRQILSLPWQQWDLVENLNLDIAIGTHKSEHPDKPPNSKTKVKILAILGNSSGINVEKDKKLLAALPGAKTTFLPQPKRIEINDQLWEQDWDILFFAGHSRTEEQKGHIEINETESLTIEQLKYGLKKAIARGLQLAIFNSCDGLGLAWELQKLQIPQVIVMAEPVPDQVAQHFLKYFLKPFSQGQSFYQAVREARERLQGLEDKLPCASWLPVICQNSALAPPTWQQLANLHLDCPYKGLFAFEQEDEEFFWGRESFTKDLVAQVKQKPLLAVIGASGSGKSSVVKAGLIPQLRRDEEIEWQIVCFRPQNNPLESLALAMTPLLSVKGNNTPEQGIYQDYQMLQLEMERDSKALSQAVECLPLSPHQHLLLVADQFEELYTPCPKEEEDKRHRFLDNLLNAVKDVPYFHLVLTLRADFFKYALSDRDFADALQDAVQTLGPMNREELQQVIEKPAKKLGVSLKPGLTKRILKVVENEPGYLPLLEFALEQMWKKQQNAQLTHEAYEEIGGVKQAVAKYAEEQFKSLSKKNRERTQRVFIQLICPGEGTEDTRRLATRDEVGEDNWDLVTKLASARLVVTGSRPVTTEREELKVEETVEIVHEALIREWQRLRNWMKLNREFRTWQERLKTRIQEWKEGKGELLSKTRLRIAQEWRQKRGQELSSEQENFIKKSRQQQMRNRWLVRGIASIMGIIGFWTGAEFYKKSCDVGERVGQDCFRFIITSGDSKLFVGTTNEYLENGVDNFNSAFSDLIFFGKFVSNQDKLKQAQKDFKKAKEAAPYDPIPLIYYNNAKAITRGNPYKLAVVVPVDAHEEIARNMLRGVASAQDEFNQKRENSDAPLLEIIIANDKNNKEIAQRIAKRLIREDVLGIVGHRSSGSSLSAIPIYDAKGISMVSPTSSSTDLDQYNVFFRAVASNEETAKDFYDYAKENCLNKNNQVWVVYDSKADHSKNLKEWFDWHSKQLRERFDEKDLNDFSEKNEVDLQQEIKKKIDQGVKCAILLPSTRTTSTAISIVYAQNQIFDDKNQNPSKEQKIQFLSGPALYNDETLKKDGSPLKEGLTVVVPKAQLDQPIKKSLDKRWEGNVSWRTYTSYKASQVLIDGLEKLDQTTEESTRKKREIVRNYLNELKKSSNKQESCLIRLEDTHKCKPENQDDEPKCLELKDSHKE